MKKVLFTTIIVLALAGKVAAQESVTTQETQEIVRLSEPIEKTTKYEVFGSKFNHKSKAVSLGKAISKLEKAKNKDEEMTISGTILSVCQKKGCFMYIQDGDLQARVSFADYSFFVPSDAAGKSVVLVGKLELKEITEEKAKHFLEDLGKPSDHIVGPQKEWSVVASSVKIQN